MGTRALTHIMNAAGKALTTIYRQSDGYISCHGMILRDFLGARRLVNGISGSRTEVFNGVGCLAAALICHLKMEDGDKIKAGRIYIYPAGENDSWVDYIYTIYPDSDSDTASIMCKIESHGKVIFDGLVAEIHEEAESDDEE